MTKKEKGREKRDDRYIQSNRKRFKNGYRETERGRE
jgi:hypothetical protein